MIRGDVSEILALSSDLTQVGAKAVPALRGSMGAVGEAFAQQWASNAAATSGQHGVHYPASIDSELVFSLTSITVEAGPNADKPQGSMGRGFEFGSVNQPPHLDGVRAMDAIEPRAEQVIDTTVGFLFG